MTVAELIEELQQYPPTTVVMVYNDDNGWEPIEYCDTEKNGSALLIW